MSLKKVAMAVLEAKIINTLEERRIKLLTLGETVYTYWTENGKPEFSRLAFLLFQDGVYEQEIDIATALYYYAHINGLEIHIESVEPVINEYEFYLLTR